MGRKSFSISNAFGKKRVNRKRKEREGRKDLERERERREDCRERKEQLPKSSLGDLSAFIQQRRTMNKTEDRERKGQ